MTIKPLVMASFFVACAAAPAVAQNQAVAQAMMAQSHGKYVAPACSADKGKQFKVSSGYTYLKSAMEAKDPQTAASLLKSGNGVITEAIKEDGQDKAASAWYGLGWIDLFQGDVVGADSSLDRALKLAPDCKTEIENLRKVAYRPLYNSGIEALQAGDTTKAITDLQQAMSVMPSSGFAPYQLGLIYSLRKQPDSAIKYFNIVNQGTSSDSLEAKVRNRATYNQAIVMINNGQGAAAVPLLEQYVKANPSDADAKSVLARAYRAAGQTDKAKALDAETGTTTAAGPVANTDFDAALKLYNSKDYAGAAEALKKVVAAEPTNVAALQAQANTYLALKDGPALAEAAGKLVALEPLNVDAMKLQQEGYRLSKQPEKANAVGEQRLKLPASVTVTELTLHAASATLGGTATGVQSMDAKTGKPIDPHPFTLAFEMLDKSGKTVATQDVAFEALAPSATKPFSFEVKGEGITGYRYTVK